MTTYIPSITLPEQVFAQPAVAILLPVALGLTVGLAVRRTYNERKINARFFSNNCWRFTATETQRTYLALKQPPFRPPPQVFGPMWTAIYGLMGYAAYRAWTTGMSSMNPTIRDLTKASIYESGGDYWLMRVIPLARRNSIYHSAWSKSHMDAYLLQIQASHCGYG